MMNKKKLVKLRWHIYYYVIIGKHTSHSSKRKKNKNYMLIFRATFTVVFFRVPSAKKKEQNREQKIFLGNSLLGFNFVLIVKKTWKCVSSSQNP